MLWVFQECGYHVSQVKPFSVLFFYHFQDFNTFCKLWHTPSHTASASLTEQVGQEILSNLHSDREKIQRARERVSTRMPPAHTSLSILATVCETVEVWQLVSTVDSIHHFLHGLPRKHTQASPRTENMAHRHTVLLTGVHTPSQLNCIDKVCNVLIYW